MSGCHDEERGGTLRIAANVRRGLVAKVFLLILGGILLSLFMWALLTGEYATFDTNMFWFTIWTVGLGTVLLLGTIHGGFVRRSLTIDETGITLVHWPSRKRIGWPDLKSVEFLGVNHPKVSAYAVVFNSATRRINIASEFDRSDLKRVVDHLNYWRREFTFDIIDSE